MLGADTDALEFRFEVLDEKMERNERTEILGTKMLRLQKSGVEMTRFLEPRLYKDSRPPEDRVHRFSQRPTA